MFRDNSELNGTSEPTFVVSLPSYDHVLLNESTGLHDEILSTTEKDDFLVRTVIAVVGYVILYAFVFIFYLCSGYSKTSDVQRRET